MGLYEAGIESGGVFFCPINFIALEMETVRLVQRSQGTLPMLDSELWLLFSSSFLSATLLPGASEAAVLYLAVQAEHAPWLLVGVATLGNTLGGFTNYGIGILAARGIRLRYFEREDLRRPLERIRRYGPISLLLAWMPVIGDPLCLAAGYLRLSWLQSLFFMALGKLGRYVALVAAATS